MCVQWRWRWRDSAGVFPFSLDFSMAYRNGEMHRYMLSLPYNLTHFCDTLDLTKLEWYSFIISFIFGVFLETSLLIKTLTTFVFFFICVQDYHWGSVLAWWIYCSWWPFWPFYWISQKSRGGGGREGQRHLQACFPLLTPPLLQVESRGSNQDPCVHPCA